MTDPTRISPQEASAKLAEGWTYVDVRTTQEFEAGHPPGAVNVPIMHAGAGGMVPNADFLAVMTAAFPWDAKLVVGCKAGGRSARWLGRGAQPVRPGHGAGVVARGSSRRGGPARGPLVGRREEEGWLEGSVPRA
jgi:rhodanese-related sulfurtransferase